MSRRASVVALLLLAPASALAKGPPAHPHHPSGHATPAIPGVRPAIPPTRSCTHHACAIGPALVIGCSDCATSVCSTDTFCCDTAWDSICVNEANAACGNICVECGNGYCEPGEGCTNCSADCGECPPPPSCGDFLCDPGEDCVSCLFDCGECPPPPPVCGDGVCDPGEGCLGCASDCGECPATTCGDAICTATYGESCSDCPRDCGACSTCRHEVCAEGGPLAAECSACATSVCDRDPFCCVYGWDALCVGEVGAFCSFSCQ